MIFDICWKLGGLFFREAGNRESYWKEIRLDHPLRKEIVGYTFREKAEIISFETHGILRVKMDLEDVLFLKDFMNLTLYSKSMRNLFQEYLREPEKIEQKVKAAILAKKIKHKPSFWRRYNGKIIRHC